MILTLSYCCGFSREEDCDFAHNHAIAKMANRTWPNLGSGFDPAWPAAF